jgi:2-polyprenyl-6-methoxyphenol hydroxylase-like FAD-dependent oxidoreductase
VGAGPTGLILGAALGLREHLVTVVDRDPGPGPDGSWKRRGVMQFEHAHGFRPQVPLLLREAWPAAYDAWIALGAEPVTVEIAGQAGVPMGVRSRRSTFERALRAAGRRTPGLKIRTGHVDSLRQDGARVVGAMIDGVEVDADLVVDASGRSGRLLRPEPESEGDCGLAYVNRGYRLTAGAEPGPLLNPLLWVGNYDGYQVLVFLHEQGHFSVLFVRPTADEGLKPLRHRTVFEAACRAVPALACWTNPGRAVATTDVLVGGALRNVYTPQAQLQNLVSVGDAVSTTTPTAGRGIAMACMQIDALLGLLDRGADPHRLAEPFETWSQENIRPWVEEHIVLDTESVRLWQGDDIDLAHPLSSTRILDAAQMDDRISTHVGGYLAMTALPATLAPAQPLARAVYQTGWRPQFSEGPSRDELLQAVSPLSRTQTATA